MAYFPEASFHDHSGMPSAVLLLCLLLMGCPGSDSGQTCSCRCGSRDGRPPGPLAAGARVYQGTESEEGGRPFQARLIYGTVSQCGGSVYNARTIITAAHCLRDKGPMKELRVYLGRLTRPASASDPTFTSEEVTEILIHPSYRSAKAGFDIGIVRLGSPIQYNRTIQPIPPMEPGEDLAGKVGTVSGWGMTNHIDDPAPEIPATLLQASGTILSRQACIQLMEAHNKEVKETGQGYVWMIRSRKGVSLAHSLCVKGPGGSGSCGGDSGGPLTCQTGSAAGTNPTRLCGIVSTGYGCGYDAPVVYTQVSDPETYKWILDNAGPPDLPTLQY